MRPIGSQAGSQAVIDARVLAYELANASNPVAGLESYENIRRPITNEIVFRNREYGPEIVMQMAEERAPNGFSDIDAIIPYAEREQIALSFKQLAGFDPKGLNARPSVNVDTVLPNKPNVG